MRSISITYSDTLIDVDIVSEVQRNGVVITVVFNINNNIAIITASATTTTPRRASGAAACIASHIDIIARLHRCIIITVGAYIPGFQSIGKVLDLGLITKNTFEVIIPAELTIFEAHALAKEQRQGITHCLQLAAVDGVKTI